MAEASHYIHSESFFDHDRWGAHDKVGELLARGVTQVTVAKHNDEWTVSWIERKPQNALVCPGASA